jgi:hypothetical protein
VAYPKTPGRLLRADARAVILSPPQADEESGHDFALARSSEASDECLSAQRVDTLASLDKAGENGGKILRSLALAQDDNESLHSSE